MISSAEIGPDGEVRLIRPLADQRFLEPNSGIYFQISGKGFDDFRSRSLWDRDLQADDEHQDLRPHVSESKPFSGQHLRLMERNVPLPGAHVAWRFLVAQAPATRYPKIRQR